jgi:hypothetical protein
MIRLQRAVVNAVEAAQDRSELYIWLQKAIELEHSTIPPYLTAMYSLKPGPNDGIGRLIRSIVVEEMLHLTIAGNILIAIGGRPAINTPEFIPAYPGPLPMSIGGADFKVGIEAFSKPLVENVFMKIEEPEHPIPVRTLALAEEAVPDFATIGEFYKALKAKLAELVELGKPVFTVGAEQQVLGWFPGAELFPIVDLPSAFRGIDIIVDQGEGTSTDPFERPGDPAHYYKFGEILHGRAIVKTATGFAYAGDPIPFDPAGVYPMRPNPKINYFEPGTQARLLTAEFASAYSSLLNVLHAAFNGAPGRINGAIGLMYELRMIAVRLMQTSIGDGSAQTAGPSYEYVDVIG